jgi:hypothetical protein
MAKREGAVSLDAVHLGPEPVWDDGRTFETDVDRDCAILKAFNWYNSMASENDRKKWILDYVKHNKYNSEIIKTLSRLDGKDMVIEYGDIPDSLGFDAGIIARLLFLGCPLAEVYKGRLDASITFLCRRENRRYAKEQTVVAAAPTEPKRPNVQEFIASRVHQIIPDLEEIFDSLMKPDGKVSYDLKAYFADKDLKGVHFSGIREWFSAPQYTTELDEAISGVDPDIAEAYTGYTKAALKAARKFVAEIVEACGDLTTAYKASKPKTIRRKSSKSPIDIVKNLKFKKEDVDRGLKSVSAFKIVGAQRLTVFNCETEMFTIFEANSAHGLSVKGSSILHFDEKKSKTKKLRKPKEVLAACTGQGIRAVKGVFDKLTTKEKEASGRINEHCILFGVY